jgi:AsmA family protein
MKRGARLLILSMVLTGGLAAGLTSLVLYLRSSAIDLSALREPITRQLKAVTGRDVKITGKISLGLSLIPTLDVEGMQIENEPWGKADYFLRVGEARIRVHLMPLLRGRVEIASVSAKHVQGHLESDGEKRRNWNLLAEAVTQTGEAAAIPEIGKVEFTDIKVDYRELGEKAARFSLHLDTASLKNDEENGIGSFELSGKLNEDTISVSGQTAPLFTVSPEQPRQFDARIEISDIQLSLDGSVKFPFEEFTYADFSLEAPKGFTAIASSLGVELPDYGPVQIAGNITPFGEELHFGNMTAKSGDSDVNGFVIVRMEQPLRLRGELRSKFMDLDPYIPETPPTEGRIFSADEFVISFPEAGDFRLKHQAEKLKVFDQEFANSEIEAHLNSTGLLISRMDADYAGGRLVNSMNIRPQGNDLVFGLNHQVRGVDLIALIEKNDWPNYAQGKITAIFEGESRGASAAALAARLNGRLFAEITEGAIPIKLSTMLSGSIKNLFASFKNMFSGKDMEAAIECGFAGFAIQDGVAGNKALLIMTDKAVMTGKGDIDLRKEYLNFRLSPRSRDPELINLAVDVEIEGPLVAPEFKLNKGSVVKSVGATAGKTALGVALGPLGVLLGAAGSVMTGGNAAKVQCEDRREKVYQDLQKTGPWPELQALE